MRATIASASGRLLRRAPKAVMRPGRERHALRIATYLGVCAISVGACALALSGRTLPPGVPGWWPLAGLAAGAALALVEVRADEAAAQVALTLALLGITVGFAHMPGPFAAIFGLAAVTLHPLAVAVLCAAYVANSTPGFALAAGSVVPVDQRALPAASVSLAPWLLPAAVAMSAIVQWLTARLAQVYAQMAALHAAQVRMIDTIGHEIRTPLTEIKVLTDLLVRVLPLGPPVEQLQRMTPLLQGMRRHCDELAGVVERAQWYQRLAAQPAALGTAATDVTELLRELTDEARPRAGARRIRLELDVPARLVAPVNARALRRAVECVLDNALKFSPEGGRTRVGCARRRAYLEIWVEDDGPGIRAEDLPYVCEPFFHREYVIDAADSQRGIGLGLPIARQIVEAHAGELHIDSVPGRGTCVRLLLPLAARRSVR